MSQRLLDYGIGLSVIGGIFIATGNSWLWAPIPLASVICIWVISRGVVAAKKASKERSIRRNEEEIAYALKPKTYSRSIKCVSCRNYWWIYLPEGTPFMIGISKLLDDGLKCEQCSCQMTADNLCITDINDNWVLYRNVPTTEKREKLEAEMADFRKQLTNYRKQKSRRSTDSWCSLLHKRQAWQCECGWWNNNGTHHCHGCKMARTDKPVKPGSLTVRTGIPWQCSCWWNEGGEDQCQKMQNGKARSAGQACAYCHAASVAMLM